MQRVLPLLAAAALTAGCADATTPRTTPETTQRTTTMTTPMETATATAPASSQGEPTLPAKLGTAPTPADVAALAKLLGSEQP